MNPANKDIDWDNEEQVSETRFKWVVEIEVSGTWVADGFDLTDERAKSMIESALPYAYPHETAAKVKKAPEPTLIRKCQGYAV